MIDLPKDLVKSFSDPIFVDLELLGKEKALKKLEDWLKNKNDVSAINQSIERIKKLWNKKESIIIESLEQIIEKPIHCKEFKTSFTSFGLCPYDSRFNWFMVSTQYDLDHQLTSIVHELLHLQFEHYYGDVIKKELSAEQFNDLKEAMTVILNVNPFNEFLLAPDQGYQQHQNLRKQMLNLWVKRKDFDDFVGEVIKIIEI